MTNSEIRILFRKLAAGTASAEELVRYYQMTHDPAYEDEIKGMMKIELYNANVEQEVNLERINKVYQALQNEIDTSKQRVIYKRLWFKRLWFKTVVAAASIIAILSIGTLMYFDRNQNGRHQVAIHNDVAPGKQGATLTLSNGKKIYLGEADNGKLADEAGVTITKTLDGQLIYEIKDNNFNNKMNTIATSNGETYRVQLPDGSTVWLNAASSLTYAANLIQKGKRIVKLSGEGYFEIAKDKLHPFIVKTADQEVEVLGTHFNINSYRDEPITATTLLEGLIKVNFGSCQQILNPGFQARNNGYDIKISKANLEGVTDWKDGEFNFDEIDFRVAMRKIARWYNVEIVYDSSVPTDLMAGGWISRSNTISTVLKLIEKSGLVHFKLEGRKVYVYQ